MIVRIACALVLAALVAVPHGAHAGKVLLREDFNDLAAWREVFFPKIPAHSTYTIENRDGGSVLAARALRRPRCWFTESRSNIYSHPDIRWRGRYRTYTARQTPGSSPGRYLCASTSPSNMTPGMQAPSTG